MIKCKEIGCKKEGIFSCVCNIQLAFCIAHSKKHQNSLKRHENPLNDWETRMGPILKNLNSREDENIINNKEAHVTYIGENPNPQERHENIIIKKEILRLSAISFSNLKKLDDTEKIAMKNSENMIQIIIKQINYFKSILKHEQSIRVNAIRNNFFSQ